MQNSWQHEVITYYGVEAHRFSSATERLVVVPFLSGRTMFYGPLNGPNLFYERVEELALIGQPLEDGLWRNYGGYKCWLAPQEQTGWPPNTAIDGAPYEVLNLEQTAHGYRLVLQGPPAAQFGVRMLLTYELSHTQPGVTIWQGFENISTEVVEWSAWSVTQVPTPGYVSLPAAGRIYNFPEFSAKPEIENQQLLIQGQPPEFKLGVQPVGADTPHVLVYQRPNTKLKLVKSFEPEPNQLYPHNNSLEIYNCHVMPYGEIEFNSPLVKLQPGERYQFRINWSIES
jgi:hypothetical protein